MKQDPLDFEGRKKSMDLDPMTFPPSTGNTGWRCPSNIAIVKYWGKKPPQLPRNPSLSITLKSCYTETRLAFRFTPGSDPEPLKFSFHGKENQAFGQRIAEYIGTVSGLMPVLKHCSLKIDSENSFPHSTGIASSASSMGALALCLMQMEEQITGYSTGENRFVVASGLARLGSGSAARSLYPGMAIWGLSEHWKRTSNEHAIPLTSFHSSFREIRDTILIVESTEKEVSSSIGHHTMEDHLLAPGRYEQARSNMGRLKRILREGDWNGFLSVAEEEALTLHAMMMSGRPGYVLMKPGSLSIIQKIRTFRDRTGIQAGFTLDAGANVHLLHRGKDEVRIGEFVQRELVPHCEKGMFIRDGMGEGPELL